MEEQARPAAPPRRADRRREVEARIKALKKQQRKRVRSQRSTPGWIALRIALIVLVLFFAVSFSLALWRAATFQGDAATYETDYTAVNAPDLQSYLSGATPSITPPHIAAASAILIEGKTSQVLYEKNPDKPLANASTTKIITGIIVLERCNLKDRVTVSRRAATTPEQSIWLKEGEVLTVEQLLNALLIQSANDAAVALAEHTAGSVEAFAEIMNQEARGLGAVNSNFVTPNGLDDPDHYTTARDLALITSHAMRNEEFRKIITTDSYEIPWPDNPYARVCENHNRLLDIYPAATGVKTGYTNKSGKCLVGSAAKNGRELISVVLNGGDGYFQDSADLLEYGFTDFVEVVYARAGEGLFEAEVGNLPQEKITAAPSSDLALLVRNDRVKEAVHGTMRYVKWLGYPVEEGQAVGALIVKPNGSEIEVPLVAVGKAGNPNIFSRLWAFFLSIFTAGAGMLGIIVLRPPGSCRDTL
jgi:D-alanyl-D-alanine carboxypeptidase (penicillin-binding protein 5/6)